MQYSAQILTYFKQTLHAGSLSGSEILIGEASSSAATDSVRFFIHIENAHCKAIRFQATGSVSTIACAEFLAEWAESKALSEMKNLTADDIKQHLDLPSLKIHSALLVLQAFENALTRKL